MTQEQYIRLEQFENHLFTAYKCNYVRMLDRNTAGNLAELFEQLYNQKSRILNGCGHCVLSDLKRLGEDYFKYKDELEKIEIPEIKPMPEDPTIEWNKQLEVKDEPEIVINTESEDKPKRKNNKVTKKDNKNK